MAKTESHSDLHKRMVKLAHPDAKQDRAMVKKMVKKEALTGRERGGVMPGKKSPKSQVNVVIAPRGGGDRAGMPPALGAGPGPVGAMPSRPAVPVVPPMAVRGPVPAGPSAPMPVKKGGKVPAKKRANGGPLGSSPDIARKFANGGAPGTPRSANYNYDTKETKKMGSYNYDTNEVRKTPVTAGGGKRALDNTTKPKPMTGYDAGAGSGEGRLEKEGHYGVKAKVRDR